MPASAAILFALGVVQIAAGGGLFVAAVLWPLIFSDNYARWREF